MVRGGNYLKYYRRREGGKKDPNHFLFVALFKGPVTRESSREMLDFLKHLETKDNIKVPDLKLKIPVSSLFDCFASCVVKFHATC